MQATVVQVAVKEDQKVEAGQLLFVVEAMKMEQPLLAPRKGEVHSVAVGETDKVAAGQLLCRIDEVSP
jgi:acetyl-CoA/propionyl-CoA carboxylase biotin carboxyl carrier protein